MDLKTFAKKDRPHNLISDRGELPGLLFLYPHDGQMKEEVKRK